MRRMIHFKNHSILILFILIFTFYIQNELIWAQCSYKSTFHKRGLNEYSKTSGENTNPVISLSHYNREMLYDVKHHNFTLKIYDKDNNIHLGKLTTLAQVVSENPLDTFAFELTSELSLDSVWVNEELLKKEQIKRNGIEANLILSQPISPGSFFQIRYHYHGTPNNDGSNWIGGGFMNVQSPTWGTKVTFSLSQPYSALKWFPVKQVLSDKIDSVYMNVITDKSCKVGSNGLLLGIDTLPGNDVMFRWKSTYPIDYYLISVAVGKYQEYSYKIHVAGMKDSLLIQNYIYQNQDLFNSIKPYLDGTGELVKYFSELFGVYPFYNEKYGHVMAPISGGMEHQTMTTQGIFDIRIVAHELAHHWFGDNITCSGWNDLFLNEGFACYCEFIAFEKYSPNIKTELIVSKQNEVKLKPDGSVYCPNPENEERLFDSRLTYQKGASILHTLRFLVNNDSIFFQAIRDYQKKFQYNVASNADFKSSFESSTGKDFSKFFAEWYFGEGYPIYNIEFNSPLTEKNNVKERNFYLNLRQSSTSEVTPIFSTDFEVKVIKEDNTFEILRFSPKSDDGNELFIAPLKGLSDVTEIEWDPNNWVVDSVENIEKNAALSLESYSEGTHLNIFPNPTSDRINIMNNFSPMGQLEISLYDMNGKNVINQLNPINNSEILSLSVNHLPNGVYCLIIISGNRTSRASVIIER